jgi:ubiquinone/menaquinone biosynthesis C-methylase UbiE
LPSDLTDAHGAPQEPETSPISWWTKKIIAEGGLAPGKRLLDGVCGTGYWTRLLVESSGCEAVGVEEFPELIALAREKDPENRITWLEADIYRPPLENAGFDCALIAGQLPRIDDPYVVFRVAYVALKPGGPLLIRQATLDQVIDDPVHRFFPEVVTIALKRIPLPVEIGKLLAKAGFSDITSEAVRMRTRNNPQDWLPEAEARVRSIRPMISEEALQRGLGELQAYIEAHPDDPWLLEENMTLFVARKPESP